MQGIEINGKVNGLFSLGIINLFVFMLKEIANGVRKIYFIKDIFSKKELINLSCFKHVLIFNRY